MEFAVVCIGMIALLGVVAAVANRFDKGNDEIERGHDCETCTEAEEGKCKVREMMKDISRKDVSRNVECGMWNENSSRKDISRKEEGGRRKENTLLMGIITLILVSGCSTGKNTAESRWWHAFNARYNTFYNGKQAFIEGNISKEQGNEDDFTETLPLYMVGNKESRDLGKSNYDRAIEKAEKAIKMHSIKAKPEWKSNRTKTPKDREWLGRKEYNPFIWKAWMLLGKAQFQKGEFDEAAATFSYMSRLYQTQPLQYGLARAWLAKCYAELDWLYDVEDVIRNMNRDSTDYRTVKDWDYTYADYYLRSGDLQKAAVYLRKVIRHERRSKLRARQWYIMGQIQKQMGNNAEAEKAFRKVIGCHPPYRLEFNARISLTEVLAGGNARGMISRLKRMAANDNNKDYLDQVYYAMGNIHLAQKDTAQAIAAYEKGNERATRSGTEKGVLLLTLGNLYWQQERYNDAQRCYGLAIGLLDKDRDDYSELSQRSVVLDELVPYTDAIHMQDSLLELSAIPEAEQLKVIDRIISDLKKKEKEERRRMEEAESEQIQQQNSMRNSSMNRMNSTAPRTPAQSQGNGQWYFYNPMAVSQGKATFQQQWGKRENTDNWQRMNRTVVNLNPETAEGDDGTDGTDDTESPDAAATTDSLKTEADSLASDPHNREYYLAQIPRTDEQKAACHEIIKDGLMHSGIIFKDKLDNLSLSEKQLTRLTTDYHDYEKMDLVWYHLFLLYSRQGRTGKAEQCLAQLKASFPQSEYTTLLADPYYAENARFGEHIEDSIYAATYQAFKDDRHEAILHNVRLSEERFPLGDHRPKFIFIDGLSRLNQGDGDGCIERMKTVVEKYPQSEVSELAGMIVKGVQEGRRLHGGKFDIGNLWSRRDVTLTADSAQTDTLSAEREQDFLFILTYPTDSVNENQLLYEMAKYNFTNFLVRNFEIQISSAPAPTADDPMPERWHRMLFSGFTSYDEALQYARMLYEEKQMAEKLRGCFSMIISSKNLELLGTKISYEEYDRFYEDTFLPMKISEEKLLIRPEELEIKDPEDISEEEAGPQEEQQEDTKTTQKKKVEDFDFGDDFW